MWNIPEAFILFFLEKGLSRVEAISAIMWPKWAKKTKNANPEMIKTPNYEGPIQKGAGTEGGGDGELTANLVRT